MVRGSISAMNEGVQPRKKIGKNIGRPHNHKQGQVSHIRKDKAINPPAGRAIKPPI